LRQHRSGLTPGPVSRSSFGQRQALKQVAVAGENRQFAEGVQAGISRVMDDYCTPPHPHGPWPPPPSVIAFELATIANALHESRLRTGILEVASQLFQKSLETVRQRAGLFG